MQRVAKEAGAGDGKEPGARRRPRAQPAAGKDGDKGRE